MIYLTNSTDLLQIVLAGVVTTNELDWVATYHKHVAGVEPVKEDYTDAGNSNGTTDVTVVPGPVENTHIHTEVSELHVHNTDTVSATVTVKMDRNSTEYILHKATLAAGAHLQYVKGVGFSEIGA